MSDDTLILKPLTGQESNPLTSCAEGSPASQSVSQESEKAPPMNAGSGLSLLDAFAYYDPAMRSWRMSQACLPGMEDTPSEKSAMIFPPAGMSLNGRLYPLPTWERPISESESGLWRTPDANDWKNRIYSEQVHLGDQVRSDGRMAEFVPTSSAVWGSVFHGKEWVLLGWEPSTLKSNHSRFIRRWRFEG